MFTGIVEEVGALRSLRVGESTATLDVVARGVLDGTAVGDSILTDGVCLTVVSLRPDGFSADVMPETVRRSTLGDRRPGAVRLDVDFLHDASVAVRFGGEVLHPQRCLAAVFHLRIDKADHPRLVVKTEFIETIPLKFLKAAIEDAG